LRRTQGLVRKGKAQVGFLYHSTMRRPIERNRREKSEKEKKKSTFLFQNSRWGREIGGDRSGSFEETKEGGHAAIDQALQASLGRGRAKKGWRGERESLYLGNPQL